MQSWSGLVSPSPWAPGRFSRGLSLPPAATGPAISWLLIQQEASGCFQRASGAYSLFQLQHSAFTWLLVYPLCSHLLPDCLPSRSQDRALSGCLPRRTSLSGSCPWPAERSVSKDACSPGDSCLRCPLCSAHPPLPAAGGCGEKQR